MKYRPSIPSLAKSRLSSYTEKARVRTDRQDLTAAHTLRGDKENIKRNGGTSSLFIKTKDKLSGFDFDN
jgi:hypothetical protein